MIDPALAKGDEQDADDLFIAEHLEAELWLMCADKDQALRVVDLLKAQIEAEH